MSSSYPIAPRKEGALQILGLQLHAVDMAAIHTYMEKTLASGSKALVLNLNIHCCNLAHKHLWLREFINGAQLVFCDGDGVRWGTKLLGMSPPPKVTYDRWIWQLGAWMKGKGYSFYFLGGEPGVSEKAAQKMRADIVGLEIVGTHHGFFEKAGAENDQLIAEISRLKPDVMVLGFGMPQQEKWLKENWEKIDCHLFLTGGAVFDYVSGWAERAPGWMIQLHMEWLFRLIREPLRLFSRYVFGNPYFFFRVLREKFSRGKKP